VSVVSTRQNQIIDENKHPMLAMIPLLDMCNHFDHPEGQVDYYVYTQNNFKKLNHFLLKI
jgi:hypothetical protein